MSSLLDAASSDSVSACGDAICAPTSRAASMADIDANLLRVIDSWPNRPAALKAAVLAIIDATKRDVWSPLKEARTRGFRKRNSRPRSI